ncbi:MAG: hypothetical protein ACRBDI_10395 [Alphaproteobacteria bacterium]
MMKRFVSILVCTCFPFSLMAAEKPEFEMMARAVIYATQADSYNLFCEKDSDIAEKFLSKFKDMKDLSENEYAALVTLRDKNKIDTARKLKEGGKACSDVEFMLSRLQVMRELKDVSYLLNGVDPATLPPDTMPDLETLLPPRSEPISQLPSTEL